jgi:hypothetical protein
MMDMIAALFFTTPIAAAMNDTYDDYDDYDHHHNIDYSDAVDPSTKGAGRGWGAVRSDGGRRYTKSTKIKHQEAPKRPKPKRKEHVLVKADEIEEYQEDVEDISFDYDLYDSFSYTVMTMDAGTVRTIQCHPAQNQRKLGH